MLERCNTLWIGSRLGAVERACLRSVLAQGHPLTLWCYEPPHGVPDGVQLCDARDIVPKRELVVHRNGSAALFSNRFRYELQRRGLGVWLDCDVYLVRPLADLPTGHLFGWQDSRLINGAVLRLPSDSPLLPPLLALFDERTVPEWLSLRPWLLGKLRLFVTGRSRLAAMPWGSAGPAALTWLARRAGLHRCALPQTYFYPRRWDDAGWITDPSVTLDMILGPETRAVHLWNEVIKPYKDAPAPPGSFLAQLQQEGAIP